MHYPFHESEEIDHDDDETISIRHQPSTTNVPPHQSSSAGDMSLVPSRNNSHNQLNNMNSQPGSRRMTGDIVLATMRRQSIGIIAQRRLLLGLLHGHTDSKNSLRNCDDTNSQGQPEQLPNERRQQQHSRRRGSAFGSRRFGGGRNKSDGRDDNDDDADSGIMRRQRQANRMAGDDDLATVLSAFYAKLLVVLGIAFPVTGVLSSAEEHASFYQGFYLYLYVVAVLFVIFMYTAHLRTRALFSMLDSFHDDRRRTSSDPATIRLRKPVARYGSFYLRVGAIAFGVGSMVYSGLEFGQYFELKGEASCQNMLVALTPAARTVLSIVQMQFIFLNTKEFEMYRHKVLARFGLMHMVATNLCEWLYVLVEETKHEIVNLHGSAHHSGGVNESLMGMMGSNDHNDNNATDLHHLVRRATASHIVIECRRTNIMGRLVQNVSPFLFPCTIEYSLICAVILFEMWKQIRDPVHNARRLRKISSHDRPSAHHFSVDCSRAHRGMFAGILVIVLTIIALILFFVMNAVPAYAAAATLGVTVCEMGLYVLTTAALALAYSKMRDLRFVRQLKAGSAATAAGIPLDCTLLLLAQSGCFIYSMFSIIGSYFALHPTVAPPADSGSGSDGATEALVTEVFSLLQTSAQTIFILNAWYRRLGSARQARDMPGRETITFLLVANMAMWFVNTLVKNRAAFRPTHLRFFGAWAWTIITHVSMPLAIFYRFHSTICLFEIWKTTYKVRPAPPPTTTTTTAVQHAVRGHSDGHRIEVASVVGHHHQAPPAVGAQSVVVASA